MVPRISKKPSKSFVFFLKEEDEVVKLVLLLFNSFLVVIYSHLWITLFVISSPNNLTESGNTFSLFLLYWLSRQPKSWFKLFFWLVELKWPRVDIELVHVYIIGAMDTGNIGESLNFVGLQIKQRINSNIWDRSYCFQTITLHSLHLWGL